MCTYSGKVINSPGCESACQGCEWTSTVSSTTQGTDCVFTWTVGRKNCDFQTNEEFNGSTTVPCSQRTKLTFYCDATEQCAGYELSLIGDLCPIRSLGKWFHNWGNRVLFTCV